MSGPLCVELFAGTFGWSAGWLALGGSAVGFDIERHPWHGPIPDNGALALQDVKTLHGSQFRNADLILASPPCFVADTLILTARGLVPIPEVLAGDLVLTHRKRWRRVLRTGSTIAPTVVARGYGGSLQGTAEHPIYARRNEGGFSVWDKKQKAPVNVSKKLGGPGWIPLANVGGCHWASPASFDPLPVPELPNSLADVPEFWWIVGRWVGDGWVRLRGGTGSGDEVIICCGHSEADDLEAHLAAFAPRRGQRAQTGELHWRRVHDRTVTKFHAASNSFARWLVTHFGRGAAGKSWPAWALGMGEGNRRAMLEGYASADGHEGRDGTQRVIRTATASKRLAIGTRLLAASLGASSNLHFTKRPATCRIEGRTVRQRDTWTASWTPDSGSNRLVERENGFLWGKVREVKPAQESARVWNLEVDEDNSYVADGIVVHNCQEFSYMAMPWTRAKQIAKALRGEGEFPDGYTGSRTVADLTALFDACFRIQREASEAAGRHIPMVVENVKGAQPWVGRARWSFGSYYLWGDVPALMPSVAAAVDGVKFNPDGTTHPPGSWFAVADSKERGARKNTGGSWFNVGSPGQKVVNQNPVHQGAKTAGHVNRRDGHSHTRHLTNQAESDAVKVPGYTGAAWFDEVGRSGSKSAIRKAASAHIARIPYRLSEHIAQCYWPRSTEDAA